MSNKSKKGFNGQPQARDRRIKVVKYLENQLKRGIKPLREDKQTISEVSLTDKDIVRINKELLTLKNRI